MHKFVSLGFDFGMQILKPLAQFKDNISGQLKYIISLVSQNISLLWPVKIFHFSGQLNDITSLAS